MSRQIIFRFSFIRKYTQQHKPNQIKLILYTKKECQLCDEAKEGIETSYPKRFSIEEIDITKDRTLFRKFKFDIPVFYYDDKFLMQHKMDKNALDKLINQHASNKLQ